MNTDETQISHFFREAVSKTFHRLTQIFTDSENPKSALPKNLRESANGADGISDIDG
jgi:hypothetical protein